VKTVYFRDYRKTDDDGYNLYCLFNALQGQSGIKVIFDKDEYEIYPDYCSERNLFVSNHGWNGPKRMAVLIEDMQDVELDFSGSVLRVHGAMIHIGILKSSNVTVKNLVLENPQTQIMHTKVVAHGENYIDLLKMQGKEQFHMRHSELVTDYMDGISFNVWIHQEYEAATEEFRGDFPLGINICDEKIEDLGNDMIRLYNVKRFPPIGNIIILNATRRLAAGVFCENSSNILCQNVTIHSCMGMGFAAQLCENITLSNFNTLKHDGRYYTANADATHFVSCSGKVIVENCTFECQLDDALNIHGMYTKVVRKANNELFVKEMHEAAKGIRIFRVGDRIQILDPVSLIPYTEKTITEIEYINSDLIRLAVAEDTDDVIVGDSAENISYTAELVFRNNIVRHNRARGILIASKGKTVIEDCLFISPGVCVQFEANGEYWYESGGVNDVTIRNNTFERCGYFYKEYPLINCVPRRAVAEGKYFHKKISVYGNKFIVKDGSVKLAHFDNAEKIIFKDNIVTENDGKEPFVELYQVADAELQADVKTVSL